MSGSVVLSGGIRIMKEAGKDKCECRCDSATCHENLSDSQTIIKTLA